MPELHRHACGAQWSGSRTCHCSGCCETFTSTSAFDKHQNRPGVTPICKDPAESGLVAHEKPWGVVWGLPGGSMDWLEDAA
jgi:hypothetical protein